MADYRRKGESISLAGLENLQLKSIKGDNFVWINIDTPTTALMNSLLSLYPFHPLDVEDCLSKTQIPKIDEYKDYLFIILHSPRYLKEKKFSIPSQVGVFLGRDFLVTVHSGELKPINRIFQKCKEDEEKYEEYMRGSPTFLLYRIIHALIENIMLMLRRVISEIEDIEDKVFDDKVDAVREITELRHNIANMRRVVFSMRSVIHALEKKIHVFTFSIPATVAGTFYGMNVNIPGGLNDPWTFWGPYTTFIIVLIASIVPVILMYIVFKRLRWL